MSEKKLITGRAAAVRIDNLEVPAGFQCALRGTQLIGTAKVNQGALGLSSSPPPQATSRAPLNAISPCSILMASSL